jgi:hypothetical protein
MGGDEDQEGLMGVLDAFDRGIKDWGRKFDMDRVSGVCGSCSVVVKGRGGGGTRGKCHHKLMYTGRDGEEGCSQSGGCQYEVAILYTLCGC